MILVITKYADASEDDTTRPLEWSAKSNFKKNVEGVSKDLDSSTQHI